MGLFMWIYSLYDFICVYRDYLTIHPQKYHVKTIANWWMEQDVAANILDAFVNSSAVDLPLKMGDTMQYPKKQT